MNSDESELSNDGKFRNFANQIDRCLKGFEYSSEWADLITNLGKLIKLLQTNSKYSVIPRKLIVGKRLSQCLHPALPAGVHLKALECYDVIFRNIGSQKLAEDIYIYCSGIFPLLSPSAMHIKNPLLKLFENHFVPLNLAIKPAFVGLLQGLLPGLEEGAEFYESANSLLEKFCISVEPIYYYTCLWQVMLQAPSVRIYGTTFLLNHYNRKQTTEDQLYLFGNSINLMLKSLTHILSDQQVLVQRQALDFVLLALNMHRSQLTISDREELCAACLTVLLRRDMSLNRRFYTWLMGTNIDRNSLIKYISIENNDHNIDRSTLNESDLHLKYFKIYSKAILIAAIKTIMEHPVNISVERLPSIKPFRIIMTLMDRAEIGSDIIEDVLFELIVYMETEFFRLGQNIDASTTFPNRRSNTLDSMNRESLKNKGTSQDEFLKTANLFFANLDSGFLWEFLNNLFTKVLNFELIPSQISHQDMTIDRICTLVKFLLKHLPIDTYSEVHSRHLPAMLSNLTNLLVKYVPNLGMDNILMLLQIYRIVFDQIIQNASMVVDIDTLQTQVPTLSSGTNISKQPTLNTASNSTNDNISKVMTQAIFNFREFSRQFCVYKLGFNDNQIAGYTQNLYNKGFTTNLKGNLDKVSISPNSLDVSVTVDKIMIDVYREICQLIVEMTSYPLFSAVCVGESSRFTEEEKLEKQCNSLPEWLICLIISGCYISEFSIKSIAMSTLLDLIYASRSVYGHKHKTAISNRYISMKKHILSKGKSLSFRKGDEIDISFNFEELAYTESNNLQQYPIQSIIFPVLSQEIIDTLDNKTIFYKVAGLSLWDFLSIKYTFYHHVSVDLINRLHQSSPSVTLIEELILQKMLADNIEECLDSHRRFILLWQLLSKQEICLSEQESSLNIGNSRTFDKCMFVLLDGLDPSNDMNNGLDVLRTLCQSWLEQAFQDGHAHKIISPLILTLLKPDTARISLHNLVRCATSRINKTMYSNEIVDSESKTMSMEEKKIYAISNENGHVKYHIKPKSSEEISIMNNKNQPVSLIQSIDKSKKCALKNSWTDQLPQSNSSEDSLRLYEEQKRSIRLHINPLDQTNSISDNNLKVESEKKYSNFKDECYYSSEDEVSVTLEHSNIVGLDQSCDHDEDNTSDIEEFELNRKEKENSADSIHEIITNDLSENNLTDDVDNKQKGFDLDQGETAEEVTDFLVHNNTSFEENVSLSKLEYQVHPLHSHLLMYCAIYDSSCAIYALSRLGIILRSLPGIAVPIMGDLINVQTNSLKKNKGDIPKSNAMYYNRIFEILARHSNALKGNNFYQNPSFEEISAFKNFNILEIILTVTTWFMCSCYPIADSGLKVTDDDILENKKVQLLSSEIINLIVQEMLSILQIGYISHRGDFVTPTKTMAEIKNVFKITYDRSNISKCTLHCMATFITRPDFISEYLSDSIIFLNECNLDQRVRDAAQILLMRLALNVLKLDYGLNSNFVLSNTIRLKETTTVSNKILGSKPIQTEVKLPLPQVFKNLFSTCYLMSTTYIAVSRQSILLTSLVACLGARKLRHLHSYCYQFIISSLGLWGRSTSAVLVPIVKKICKNIRSASDLYVNNDSFFKQDETLNDNIDINAMPIDYSLSNLACLKAVCHFLLLDEALKMYQLQEDKGSSSEQSLLGSLFSRSKDSTSKEDSMSPSTHILDARSNIIRLMPRILDSLLYLWEKTSKSETYHNIHSPSWTMGKPIDVRETILSIIKPLLQQHPTTILISLARVWPQLDQFQLSDENFIYPELIQDICLNKGTGLIMENMKHEHHRIICILEFALGWKSSFPIEKIVINCREIIRKSFPTNISASLISKKVALTEEAQAKVNLLEFLQCFLISQPAVKLSSISTQLFLLLKESSSNLSPIGSFILLKILSDFIAKVPISEDRKEQRELQDLCQKVIENVAIIAGSSLEQSSWFRRVVQVKVEDEINESTKSYLPEVSADGQNVANELQHDISESHHSSHNESFYQTNISRPNVGSDIEFKGSRSSLPTVTSTVDPAYKMATINVRCTPSSKTLTIQALQLLTMHLASILDVVYKSEEKEKVQPFLNSIVLPNVLPYLRFRSQGNLLNFRVASQLMASLSSYQHTRRSWRKDVFDMLFESYFFNLDIISIQAWKIIIDNLMTQDKSTFKEAFTKLTVNQGGGLSLFTSKEAEYEQTAICMKKLSFIIFSSELDQHVKSMPDIQERLTDCFRLGIIPQIQTQLFLCFRVILLRMSQQNLTSLWHIFLPALVAIMHNLVDDLKSDSKSGKNGDISRRLPMYLSACKLLDMILLMKEEQIPQFLYYKWTFVGNLDENKLPYLVNENQTKNSIIHTFQPQITTVTVAFFHFLSTMNIPINSIEIIQENIVSENLLLHRQSIQSLTDLAEFFFTSSLRNELQPEMMAQQYGVKIIQREDIEKCFDANLHNRYYNLQEECEGILNKEFIELTKT